MVLMSAFLACMCRNIAQIVHNLIRGRAHSCCIVLNRKIIAPLIRLTNEMKCFSYTVSVFEYKLLDCTFVQSDNPVLLP